ncbi:MAG: alpha/beta hydrolase [Betaproteobacteria bacterium]
MSLLPSEDSAWLDAQYNPRAAVPDHARFFERWRLDSARAREQADCLLDLAYGDTSAETLDVFRAAAPGAPILVFIHGGWWRAFDKSDHSFIAPPFVRAGASVVVPNYALCPAATIATIALQTARSLTWVFRHAARCHGDAQRIVVVGHSAGGHLAAMLLCCDWTRVGADLPPDLLRGALAISGVYDLEPLRRTPFLNVDLRLASDDVPRLSPAAFPAPRVPLLAVVGALESEEFRRQNALIRAAWGKAAVPVSEEIAGRHHFDVLDDLIDPAGRTHALALGLLGLPASR